MDDQQRRLFDNIREITTHLPIGADGYPDPNDPLLGEFRDLLISLVPPLPDLDVLRRARQIWGPQRLSLSEIVVRLMVNVGKLARFARAADKDLAYVSDDGLATAMGNIIVSMIRWCDDLGLQPDRCIKLALDCQEKFARENVHR